MSIHVDNFIGNILKNWVASHKPPVNGRAQLLEKAVAIKRDRYNLCALIPRLQYNDFAIQSTNEGPQPLSSWFFAQSVHASVQSRVKSYAL
jgi:hypothetical protein